MEEIRDEVDQAVFRRARHVVSENLRTVAAAEALDKRDYGAVGRYMLDSHRSLREVRPCPSRLRCTMSPPCVGVFGRFSFRAESRHRGGPVLRVLVIRWGRPSFEVIQCCGCCPRSQGYRGTVPGG